MKKICFALVAALFAFTACNTKLDNAEVLLPEEDARPVLQVAMDITAPNATKALKTEWEEDDVIYVIFDQEVKGYSGYDLRFKWQNGAWVATFPSGRDADILAKGSGTFDAVFIANRKAMDIEAHPQDANPYVTYRPTDYYDPSDPDWHTKGERVYSYYLTCRANYTVEDGVLKGNIALSLGENFVHIFIPNLTNGEAIRRYTMEVDPHLVAASFGYYDGEDGFGWNTEQAQGVNIIPGYPLKGGMSFSGLVYGDIINKVKDYTFTVTDNVEHKVYTFTAAGKSLHVGSAIVLPELSNWTESQGETLPELTWTDGQVAVDLGLPSGIKWASCNLNAMSPDMWGMQVAWGETAGKSGYSWENYKFTTSGMDETDVVFSKYAGELEMLDLADDAAHANMQGKWRVPTTSDCYDLISNCTWTLATMNGQIGYQIKSNVTGYTDNWIFLPLWGANTMTSYMTSELVPSQYNTRYIRSFVFNIYEQGYDYIAGIGDGYRCYPLPVRPVYDPALGGNGGGNGGGGGTGGQTGDGVPLCRLNNGDVLYVATKNLGATEATDYGNYYFWGDTEGHDLSYSFFASNYKYAANYGEKVTKYCTKEGYWAGSGDMDGLQNVLPEDDAATVALGTPWHTITYSELDALLLATTRTWDSDLKGAWINGQGEFAGNKVFVPAGSSSLDDNKYSSSSKLGKTCIFWTGTITYSDPTWANIFEFDDGSGSYHCDGMYSISRINGCPIRPVKAVSE